ncbi:MAG: type chaperone [Herminiimonas sp.]|nr:type chaperone [Herminiimonas sp.]
MQEQFRRLIEDLDQLADCEASVDDMAFDESLSAALTVDQVEFLLVHSQQQHPTGLAVYCRFGPVPSDDAVRVLYRLLEVNLALSASGTATLGIESENRDVVYSFKASLASVTASALLQALRYVAEQAQQWRMGYFLDHNAPPHTSMEAHFSTLV